MLLTGAPGKVAAVVLDQGTAEIPDERRELDHGNDGEAHVTTDDAADVRKQIRKRIGGLFANTLNGTG